MAATATGWSTEGQRAERAIADLCDRRVDIVSSATGHYSTGAQRGLGLCGRVVERCDGTPEFKPRAIRGTRAVIVAAGDAT